MREIVAKLIHAAQELEADVLVVIKDADVRRMNSVVSRIESFLGLIRKNEKFESIFHRRDEEGKVSLLIGLSDHKEKDAIIKALLKRAEREAGRDGVQIWTKVI